MPIAPRRFRVWHSLSAPLLDNIFHECRIVFVVFWTLLETVLQLFQATNCKPGGSVLLPQREVAFGSVDPFSGECRPSLWIKLQIIL